MGGEWLQAIALATLLEWRGLGAPGGGRERAGRWWPRAVPTFGWAGGGGAFHQQKGQQRRHQRADTTGGHLWMISGRWEGGWRVAAGGWLKGRRLVEVQGGVQGR